MNKTTELIVLPPQESVRVVFTTPQGLEPYLQQIRAHLDTFEADVSTKKGRDAIAEAEAKEAKRREADKAHKTAINRAALDAFMAGGMTEECAKLAVTPIAKKAIPAVSITY